MEEVRKLDCFALLADHWVCLEVLEQDEAGQTQRGRVVAHGEDEDQVLQAEREFRLTHPAVTTNVLLCRPPGGSTRRRRGHPWIANRTPFRPGHSMPVVEV